MLELTSGQSELLDRITRWYNDYHNGNKTGYQHPQWFAYSGAAGCGKTTVIREFLNSLCLRDDYIGCAYTGKAVLQMLRQGLKAKTIHSLIYDVVSYYRMDPITHKKIPVFEFVLKKRLDKEVSLIIVDEAPMVNDDMCKEILSFGIPVIFVGDMNQLPPVFGRSTIMENPDFVLTQIMRQSADNPIVQLSQMVLKDIPLLEGKYGTSEVVREFDLGKSLLDDYDQIICFTNSLRQEINNYCRTELLGFKTIDPRLFDKIICRQNNWDIEKDGFYLTNGTSGVITDIDRSHVGNGYYIINFHPDYFEDGVDFEGLRIDARYIKLNHEDQKVIMRTQNEKFEYSYAITAHLSQGSEYPRVFFIDSYFGTPELTKKARYTAITRAMDRITIVSMSRRRY